jgi:hypothetical protein
LAGGLAGGVAAGGLFGSNFANPSMGGGFADMNDYQDNDEDGVYYEDEEDDDAQDGYSSGYRG